MPRDWQKTTTSPSLSANDRRNRAIAAVGSQQRQLVTAWQLAELGLAPSTIRSRVQASRLHRVHPGVFALHPPPFEPGQLWLAAVYACGTGTHLSDLSAAGLWRLSEDRRPPIHVVNPTGTGRTRPGIVVHRRAIEDRDLTRRGGIPCTTPARTILDCAAVLGARRCEEMVMAADSYGILDRARLAELVADSRGRPGVDHVRRAIGEPRVQTRSALERRMLSICRHRGVRRPRVNYAIEVDGRTFVADLCWPELRLIAEIDGWRWHGGREASARDAARTQILTIAGWRVVRFGSEEITRHRDQTGDRLLALAGPQR